MKGTPFLFTLLIGTSVFALSACDKTTATKTENAQPETTQAAQTPMSQPEVKNEMPIATQPEKVTSSQETENNATTIASKPNEETDTPVKPVKAVKKQNTQNKEKQKVLRVLEQQYQQVRCSSEAAELGENSFCRQEERRLMGEIERLKQELR